MKIINFNSHEDDYKTNVRKIQEAMKGPAIVLVWAVWCPHCTVMKNDWEQLKQSHGSKAHFVEIESTNLEKIRGANKQLFKKLYAKPDQVSYPMIKFIKDNKGKVYQEERSYPEMKQHADKYFAKNKATATKKPKKQKKQKGGDDIKTPVITSDMKKFQAELNDYIKNVLSSIK